jgi:acyl-CoA thioesterase II
MDDRVADLLSLLDLDSAGERAFRGQSRDIGVAHVFGGQVLGQALVAASRTVKDRSVHSLHAYFLARGDVKEPIHYEVDASRDGGSFSNRRVTAQQQGRQIFHLAASFQRPEPGLEHQPAMPEVPGPEHLKDMEQLARDAGPVPPPRIARFVSLRRPVTVRPVDPVQFLAEERMAPCKRYWLKTVDRLPDDPVLHQCLLAYISDFELLGTAILPHGLSATRRGLQVASLDHAMWFHRPVRVDEWLLFDLHSPSASGARGLARGEVYSADGMLVASLAQEGLMRQIVRKPD